MAERDRRKIEKGIYLIGNMVYAERTKHGKLIRRKAAMQGYLALNTNGKPTPELRKWFRTFCDQVDNNDFVELERSKQRTSCVTIGAVCKAYREMASEEFAKHGQPRPATTDQNEQTLKRLAEKFGLDKNTSRIDEMTPDRVNAWITSVCAGKEGDDLDRARTSAWSQIAQAKSVWSEWTAPNYMSRNIKLPECLFKWPKPKMNFAPSYRRPPDELRKATMTWYDALPDASTPMWVAATLMIQLAMRPGDASNLKWDNIHNEGPGKYTLSYVPSKTRGRSAKPRTVAWPISAELYELLKKRGGPEYVIPGNSPTDRYEVYQSAINPAMRGIGWDEKTYDKACYELRKLCVDAVYRNLGLERAVQISGDNAATILRFYADPRVSGIAPVDVSKLV